VKVDEFDFALPEQRIAQQPLALRDESRLLVLGRESGEVRHGAFRDLHGLLHAGDLLVLNDTRVIPARLVATKSSGGAAEILLLEPVEGRVWKCLLRARRSPKPGGRLHLADGLTAMVRGREGEIFTVAFDPRMPQAGSIPLPPYIRRPDGPTAEDADRYQTVFAEHDGAIAAPTAGLHFTEALLSEIEASGVRISRVTLHVGPGTFQPVRVVDVEDHVMHEERFELPESTALAVSATRARGGRVVAVGSTVVRTLEAQATGAGEVRSGAGRCDLFIYPGFRFRVVDAMITNFHLPRSTLLMMVAAFVGRERLLAVYEEAIEQGYRFYSYGDAMWIGPG